MRVRRQDFFCSSGRTVMCVCVNPAPDDFDESVQVRALTQPTGVVRACSRRNVLAACSQSMTSAATARDLRTQAAIAPTTRAATAAYAANGRRLRGTHVASAGARAPRRICV